MWNSKKGFEEFLSIVKKMPSMHNNYEYSQYMWKAYNQGYYTNETVNVELLMKFVGTIENLGEEDKIHRLKLWASQRIGQQVDYYNRKVKFNDS